jgi:hypothetical protein
MEKLLIFDPAQRISAAEARLGHGRTLAPHHRSSSFQQIHSGLKRFGASLPKRRLGLNLSPERISFV